MNANHLLYIKTLLKTLQTGIERIDPLIKSLSRLLRKNLSSVMRASTVLKLSKLFSNRLSIPMIVLYTKF